MRTSTPGGRAGAAGTSGRGGRTGAVLSASGLALAAVMAGILAFPVGASADSVLPAAAQPVTPDDVDGTNISADWTVTDEDTAPPTTLHQWDTFLRGGSTPPYGQEFTLTEPFAIPPELEGRRWVWDIENKVPGTASVDADGLTFTVASTTKARLQYYLGSGGYPALDALQPTLSTVFDHPLSWTQTLLSGDSSYGPTLQMKLQKEVSPGRWAQATVVSVWAPGTGSRDLAAGLWFANTPIYSDGFLQGALLNRAASGPGVDAQTLLANFGDWELVSFGPNLGTDLGYSYSFQDFSILGQSFHFQPAPVPAGTVSIGDAAAVGSPLTAVVAGWPEAATLSYQWMRQRDGGSAEPIGTPGSPSYTPVPGDDGYTVWVRVTATQPGYEQTVVDSAALTVAKGSIQAGSIGVSVADGRPPAIGSTLLAQIGGSWSPPAAQPDPSSVSWLRNGQATGVSGAAYTVTEADAGSLLQAEATAQLDGYQSVTVSSSALRIPSPDVPPPAPVPVPGSAAELPQEAALPTDTAAAPEPQPGQPRSVTLQLGAAFANQWYWVTLYSAPTELGWFWVGADGVLTVQLPDAFPAGTHTVALFDTTGATAAFVPGVAIPPSAVTPVDPVTPTPPATPVGPSGPVPPAGASDGTADLASTGAGDTGAFLAASAALLLLGAAAVVVGARRRRRSP